MYCGRRRAFTDLEIDHKIPVDRGGSDNPRNLQILCPPCNKRKGNQTDREFRRRYRELLPKNHEPPRPAIRQDAFDMVTATTNRPRNARTSQSPRSSKGTPATVDSLTIRREGGFFSDTIKLAWPTPDSDDPVTGYRLQHRTVKGGPDTGWTDFADPHEGNLPRSEINGVPQDKRFAFRIRARNDAGWGQWSKTFSEIEPEQKEQGKESNPVSNPPTTTTEVEGRIPSPILEVSFERTPGFFQDAVITRWEIPDSPAGLVTAYEIQFRMHQGNNNRDWTNPRPPHDGRMPSYRFDGVPKLTINQFSVRIRAKNDAGWGPWSEEFPDSST